MDSIIAFFSNLMDAEWIMNNGGLYVVLLIVFAETGLFLGFFLPGDYLLFLAGMMISKQPEPMPENPIMSLIYWCVLICVAAIVGNFVGYWFGRKSGNYLFERKDTWIFKKKHLIQAKDFYDKRGGVAIIIARFLPIVRTFAPIIGGVVKMDFKKFAFYNFIGAVIWVFGLMILGFSLGKVKWVNDNLHYVVVALICISTAPVLFKLIFGRNKPTAIPPSDDVSTKE